MRIRILLIKVGDHWSLDPRGFHFEPPGLYCESLRVPPSTALFLRIQIQLFNIMQIRIQLPKKCGSGSATLVAEYVQFLSCVCMFMVPFLPSWIRIRISFFQKNLSTLLFCYCTQIYPTFVLLPDSKSASLLILFAALDLRYYLDTL